MSNSPLVFIHKSNIKDPPAYLGTTLAVARHYNPLSEIFLLGDEGTHPYAKEAGVGFAAYKDYDYGEEIALFEKVFRAIKGDQCGQNPAWLKFVFKRWFYMYNFIISGGYGKFWTFDSDTLVLTDLHLQENKFKSYDCTEQCNGSCLNGFINNLEVVKGYLIKINKLFQNPTYLKSQKDEFTALHTDYAFTEMRAYAEYKKPKSTVGGSLTIHSPNHFKSILLQEVIDNETFEPCLVQPSVKQIDGLPKDSGFEMENGQKKLYYENDHIYLRHLDHPSLVKANSLNMSNVSAGTWNKILDYLF